MTENAQKINNCMNLSAETDKPKSKTTEYELT
jgi:hypothetical protein